jgi:DNA polymerase-3 subunit alpha
LFEAEPAGKKQKLKWEKELLGLYVSGHPALEYQSYIEKVALPLDKLSKELVGQKITVGGVIQKVQKILTKNQQTMYFVVLEDMKGKIELLVFPKILERIASLWEEEKNIIATGRLSDKDGAYKLIVDDAKEINQAEIENNSRIETTKSKHNTNNNQQNGNKLFITLPDDATPEMIQKLTQLLNTCQAGDCKVFLHHQTNKLETPFSIEHDVEMLEKIKNIIQEGKIEFA